MIHESFTVAPWVSLPVVSKSVDELLPHLKTLFLFHCLFYFIVAHTHRRTLVMVCGRVTLEEERWFRWTKHFWLRLGLRGKTLVIFTTPCSLPVECITPCTVYAQISNYCLSSEQHFTWNLKNLALISVKCDDARQRTKFLWAQIQALYVASLLAIIGSAQQVAKYRFALWNLTFYLFKSRSYQKQRIRSSVNFKILISIDQGRLHGWDFTATLLPKRSLSFRAR